VKKQCFIQSCNPGRAPWTLRRGASQTSRPNFFDDLFFTHFCYFQLSHLILLQPSNHRQSAEHYDRVSGNASKIFSVGPPGKNFPGGPNASPRGALPGNASIKIFWSTFPGGPNASPGGHCPPPPGECLNETKLTDKWSIKDKTRSNQWANTRSSITFKLYGRPEIAISNLQIWGRKIDFLFHRDVLRSSSNVRHC
jgi:hypothetical protein